MTKTASRLAPVRSIGATLVLALLVLVTSCDDPSGPSSSSRVARLDLGAPSLRLAVGQTLTVSATVRDSLENLLEVEVDWLTSDASIVAVDEHGTLTARAAGTASITAAAGSVARSVEVTVHAQGVHAWPDTVALLPGDTGQLAARALLPGGAPVLLSAATWESSHPEVVTVDPSGRVTALAAGQATITATAGEARLNSQVHVLDYSEPLRFVSLSAGEGQTCGITDTGATYCWGMGPGAAFGTAQPTTRCEYLLPVSDTAVNRVTHRCSSVPIRVGGGLRFTSVSVGFAHACGLTGPGEIHCWGGNEHGAVTGTPTEDEVRLPVRVAARPEFRSVSAGHASTCGVTREDEVHCWGSNQHGLLGIGSTAQHAGPTPIAGGIALRTVDVGAAHACGTTPSGEAYCWGRNVYGEIGSDELLDSCGESGAECAMTPVSVTTAHRFESIAAGTFFTCGLTANEGALCWGDGFHGKLGNGSVEHSRVPLPVLASSPFVDLSVGSSMACGLDAGGRAFCWGQGVIPGSGEPSGAVGVPRRSAPEDPLHSIAVGWGLCGIRVDGITVCREGLAIAPVPGQ